MRLSIDNGRIIVLLVLCCPKGGGQAYHLLPFASPLQCTFYLIFCGWFVPYIFDVLPAQHKMGEFRMLVFLLTLSLTTNARKDNAHGS
jgi:hypothetical protein